MLAARMQGKMLGNPGLRTVRLKGLGLNREGKTAADLCAFIKAGVAGESPRPTSFKGAEEEEGRVEGIPGKIWDFSRSLSGYSSVTLGGFCISADGHIQQTHAQPTGNIFVLLNC